MVCHALGRCRICARKHELPVFGCEKNQHALIEKIHLELIVLNTVCMNCIEKFEKFVEKSVLTATCDSSAQQRERPDCYQPSNDTVSTAEYASSEARPAMQFYVESSNEFPANENERLTPREDFEAIEGKIAHRTQNRQINDAPVMKSLSIKTNVPKTPAKVRAKRNVKSQLCCDFCAKDFTHRGDLKRHKRKHTGEKPYECPECHKKFSQLSNLARHRLVHSGERPFACADCGQSYSRKGRLANHIGRQLCRRKRRVPARLS